MMKNILLGLLLIFLLCSPVFAGVAVQEDGTYKGEATIVNFDNAIAGTFDGSTYNIPVTKVKALVDVPIVRVTATDATVFTFSPTQNTQLDIYGGKEGQMATFIFDAQKTTAYSMHFNTGFKSSSKLATGATASKVFVVNFVNDGANFKEISRTTAY